MMHDSELQPDLQRLWNRDVTFSSYNKYGTFELVWTEKGPMVEVTPADKKRRGRSFDLDDLGLTADTVLGIKGLLGLPDDGPLPERAAAELRNEEPSSPTPPGQEALKRALGRLGLEVEFVEMCDIPGCPIHGGEFGMQKLAAHLTPH